jgi:hypothetical protein
LALAELNARSIWGAVAAPGEEALAIRDSRLALHAASGSWRGCSGAFLAACDAVGWPRGPDGKPMPPDGAALQDIGPTIASPSIGPDGVPIRGNIATVRQEIHLSGCPNFPSHLCRRSGSLGGRCLQHARLHARSHEPG